MDILSWVSSILPTFGKKDVREKLRTISKKLTDIVKPSVELFREEIKERQLKSAYGKSFFKDIVGVLPSRLQGGDSPFSFVLGMAIDNAVKLLDQLEQYVTKNMGETIHIEGITYQKASVIRLIEMLDFFADYSNRHLSYLVASETNIEAFDKPDGNPFTPFALKYLQNNKLPYIQMLGLLLNDPKKIMTDINGIPEVIMTDAGVGEVPALAGGAADPLRLGAFPIVTSVFHWVGLRNVDYDIERYELAKKERRDIEMRLETLRQRRAGNQDAQAEVIIANYERELTLARAKVTTMEEKLR
jgi:hypothetical protein